MNMWNPALRVDSRFFDPLDERWLEYVSSKPGATAFHHPNWMNVLAESYGYRSFIIVVCDAGDRIVAGLPVLEIPGGFGGRRWVSLPFTDYCAPLYNDAESLGQLTNALVSLHETGAVRRIEVRWTLPAHPPLRSQAAYYLHTVNLNPDPQRVLKEFRRSHRQNIGTAEERGVHIEWGTEREQLRRFYTMQVETRRRKGVPVQPWSFFDLVGKQILAKGLGFVLLAYKDARCLAGGLFLHWQKTLTYKYAASCGEDQQCRPNNLLSWTAIRWGCENGFTVFDLGRTDLDNAGLRAFKSGWGAEETPLIYSTLSTEDPKPLTGRLMPMMQRVIRNSPPWVCRATGELLYKHFGV